MHVSSARFGHAQAIARRLQRCVVLILRSALLRASRRMATRVHAAILRDAAEFFIGPRFARTRWPLLRMRAEHDAAPSIFVMAGLRPGHPRLPWAMKKDVDARDKRGHDDKFQSSPFRDASLGAGPKSMTPAAMCCPHPEVRALRARLEGWQQGCARPSFETRPSGRSSG